MPVIYLKGTVNYAKVGSENYDKKFNIWVVDFYPQPESKAIMKSNGLQNKPKFDQEGKEFFKIRRDRSKKMGDEVVQFGPPKVVLATGETKDGVPVAVDYNGLIGNGSEVTLKLSVYGQGDRVGSRLEGLRIDKLIEYKRPEGPVQAKVAIKPTAEMPF